MKHATSRPIRDHKGNQVTLRTRYAASSNVEWAGYPTSGEPMLVVQFKGGGRYAYLGVSRQRVIALQRAESAGQYLNRVIKPKYEAVKIA